MFVFPIEEEYAEVLLSMHLRDTEEQIKRNKPRLLMITSVWSTVRFCWGEGSQRKRS